MSLMRCQLDAYEQEIEVQVLDCKADGEGFAVTIDRTLLFPGGGGQPADWGTLGGLVVREPCVIHPDAMTYMVHRAIELGPAELRLDWSRRFDHMQQHTAQHLLSALAQDHFGLETEAFHLNPERSDVVLGGGTLDSTTLRKLEALANDAIRQAIPVRAKLIEADQLGEEGVRSRRLPPGHTGPLRVVEIEGVDLNTCGGTHVRNTAELQAIRLLQFEDSKGSYRVHYLAGERVLAGDRDAWGRSAELTERLCCGPAEHVHAVDRIMQQAKVLEKQLKAQTEELGAAIAQGILAAKGPVP